MISYKINSTKIKNKIYIPKYYNPEIRIQIDTLQTTHNCVSIGDLVSQGVLMYQTGDEIGKGAYGTGNIPFVRTSDISNWELNTSPKQGVDRDIYDEYAYKQDVREGDILFVRDGTYLIGRNCFITKVDKELLYQSHILKIRVTNEKILNPELLFLLLNTDIVQKQIRSFQFTADIIDTIGSRFDEIILPIPNSKELKDNLIAETRLALNKRIIGKAFIKHCPKIIQEVLLTGSVKPIDDFFALDIDQLIEILSTETISSEFGKFESFFISSKDIINNIFLPKYYDPQLKEDINNLSTNCSLISMEKLNNLGEINFYTGDEIGKQAYGTGNIPFIRTSDFSNWEIKHDPKQSISLEIYEQYAEKEDVRANDIFLVRDGTYLIGNSCIITEYDAKSLYCGGIYKIRILDESQLDPYLFLGLLNSYIVKRQIRTKQFTRDVIDTIGNRINEVIIPIPKSQEIRNAISKAVREVIEKRIAARQDISKLAKKITL